MRIIFPTPHPPIPSYIEDIKWGLSLTPSVADSFSGRINGRFGKWGSRLARAFVDLLGG